MRQVGVLAAPGLIALRAGSAGMIDRLAEDHANARFLAESIAELDGITSPGDIAQPAAGRLDPARVATNFVVFKVERDRAAFIDALASRGVLVVGYPHGQIRAVTHYGIERPDIETAVSAFRDALADTGPAATGRPAGGVAIATA